MMGKLKNHRFFMQSAELIGVAVVPKISILGVSSLNLGWVTSYTDSSSLSFKQSMTAYFQIFTYSPFMIIFPYLIQCYIISLVETASLNNIKIIQITNQIVSQSICVCLCLCLYWESTGGMFGCYAGAEHFHWAWTLCWLRSLQIGQMQW
jgi:hypothetical protein